MYPFSTHEYRSVFARHFGPISLSHDGNFELLADKAVLVDMKPVLNNQEITDFGELIVATDIDHVHTHLKESGVHTIQYDYIREDSILFHDLLKRVSSPPIQQETSPYVLLPSTWEQYLESLSRTDRKELKRKFKRLDTVPHTFSVLNVPSPEDFETFIRLHRLSDTAKDHFMTDEMKDFFQDLLTTRISGWSQKIAVLKLGTQTVASVFIFENNNQVLLYNSGYDPEQKFYSVGLMLKAWLIRYAIESGKTKVDFLRGSERYKYDLGAVDLKLFRFIVSV